MYPNEEKQVCPIMSQGSIGGVVAIACQKEKCAWWIEDKQKCAIAAIGGEKYGKR